MKTKSGRSRAFPRGRGSWPALCSCTPAAYIYIVCFGSRNDRLWFGVFVLLFIAMTEIVNRGRPHPKESWVWLGCVLLMSACVAFGWGRVWPYGLSMVMVHPLAVWWVLSRSGRLAEGESGHLLPLDAFNGFITMPFGNFALRIRCIAGGLRGRGRGESGDKEAALGGAAGGAGGSGAAELECLRSCPRPTGASGSSRRTS